MSKAPKRVAVTGAAGQIGYSLLFRIASGEMLGKDQPVILQLLDLPQAQQAVKGVMMELEDCAFPLLAGMVATDDPNVAFKDADVCLLVGARPRTKGMERADLLTANGAIFTVQGKAIAENANEDVKVLVVGNPCNTNAYIAAAAARKVGRTNPNNYHGMLRLDHNRALSQLAGKIGRPVSSLKKLVVWGNHSPTMYADYRNTTSNGDSVKALINDHAWNNDVFLPTVGKRGAAIIEARGLSSAASAANAAIDHIRDWVARLRRMGDAGCSVRRLLRHSGRYRVRLPVRVQGRFLQDHPGSGNRRVQPRENQHHAQGTDRRGRSRQGHAVIHSKP